MYKTIEYKTKKYAPVAYIILIIALIGVLLTLNACGDPFEDISRNTDTGSTTNSNNQPYKEQTPSTSEKRETVLEKAEREKFAAEEEIRRKEAAEKKRKEREIAIAEFPIKVEEVRIIEGEGNDDNTYVSLSVTNTGKRTISNFTFTYIGYDSFGEARAEAGDERFIYEGKIKPGSTLDLISDGYRWQLTDHSSEGWYDDYGALDDEDGDAGGFDKYYDGNNYTDSYESPFQTRTITGVQISVYQAQDIKGKTYKLGVSEREWSYISEL